MKRFFRKALRGLAILLATLVVLLLAFYAEEDWRGARDWAACQRELAAKGETLDLRQLVPPGKPEDDLSKVPIFAEVYQRPQIHYVGLIPQETIEPVRLDKVNIHLGNKDYNKYPKGIKDEPGELIAWQKFYRSIPQAHLPPKVGTSAEDVLQALSQFDSEWVEIQTALSNSRAYWPINYERPFLPPSALCGVQSTQLIAMSLPLRALAHLENNQADLAEKDYLFSLRLDQLLSRGCFLVNYLILISDRSTADTILSEGLRRQAWRWTASRN